MFRRIIPLVVLGAGVLGCSKKDNPNNPGQNPADNTDPNAAYTIKFRGFEKGDKTEVVRARDASSTSKTVNSTQTQKDEFRYQSVATAQLLAGHTYVIAAQYLAPDTFVNDDVIQYGSATITPDSHITLDTSALCATAPGIDPAVSSAAAASER